MLKTLLEAHPDWQVCVEAGNGLEAVQKAAELKPDVIILDLAMPVMDGLQAAREILSASSDVPILMYTNHVFPSLAVEAKTIGIRQVVNKGVSGVQLLSAVETLLNERNFERQRMAAALPTPQTTAANLTPMEPPSDPSK
jgi:DNA-binding NarL/FixJ family response regulator